MNQSKQIYIAHKSRVNRRHVKSFPDTDNPPQTCRTWCTIRIWPNNKILLHYYTLTQLRDINLAGLATQGKDLKNIIQFSL